MNYLNLQKTIDFQPKVTKDMGKDTLYSSKEKSTKKNFNPEHLCPNSRTPTFVKKKIFTKSQNIHSTLHIHIGDLNTTPSPIIRSLKQKLKQDTVRLTEV